MGISLTKGQNIDLSKPDGSSLTHVTLGCGWGRKIVEKTGVFGFGSGKRAVTVDLDASCIMLDDSKNVKDQVWFRQKNSRCRSVKHSGDDLTGGGQDGVPNEEIVVDLSKVPSGITALVFTVNSFSGEEFEGIQGAFSVITDNSSKSEIARYELSDLAPNDTALILCKIYRKNDGWKFKALGESACGRTIKDIESIVKQVA